MTDLARLTPRSAVALADPALLRAARTDPDPADAGTPPRLAARLRELASALPHRPSGATPPVVRLDRTPD